MASRECPESRLSHFPTQEVQLKVLGGLCRRIVRKPLQLPLHLKQKNCINCLQRRTATRPRLQITRPMPPPLSINLETVPSSKPLTAMQFQQLAIFLHRKSVAVKLINKSLLLMRSRILVNLLKELQIEYLRLNLLQPLRFPTQEVLLKVLGRLLKRIARKPLQSLLRLK